MLVFFAAATGTRVVASDFWAGADRFGLFCRGHDFGNHFAAFDRRRLAAGCRAAKRAGLLMNGPLRQLAQELLEGHEAGGAAEDVVADLGLDVDHQLIKNLERLGLVFDEWIALSVGAQTDAVAQAVHAVEVLLPQPVNRAENGVALDGLELSRVFNLDFQLVSRVHFAGDEFEYSKLSWAQA